MQIPIENYFQIDMLDKPYEIRYHKRELGKTNRGGKMSTEVFELVQEMDLKDASTQLVLQCSPLITGIKLSNLLIIQNENLEKVKRVLSGTNISYYILLEMEYKTTLLVYCHRKLEKYLMNPKINCFLQENGYIDVSVEAVLPQFQKRYRKYMEDKREFPHEMGVLLGYPLEDVEGFIKNQGRNFLHAGYWKVYENLPKKLRLFESFELAKETLVQLISYGASIEEVIDIYSDTQLKQAI